MNVWRRELRYAVRGLAKRPGFALACVLTLALAIGANTAIFSVVNAALLRPLPYKDPARLVVVWQANPKQGIDHFAVSIPYFQGWREQNRIFEEMAAFAGQDFDLTGAPGPERITGKLVSANFFSLLGVQPAMGRTFLPSEDQPDHLKVAVISYDLWQRRFATAKFSNQVITTSSGAYTVVGVMPPDFQLFGPAAIWTPLGGKAESLHLPSGAPVQILAAVTPLNVIARLKPGITLREAQSDMDTITRSMAKAFASPWEARIVDLRTELIGDKTPRILLGLLIAVGLVLLVACANIANLQLARIASRQQEMATRMALGATRGRLMYQLLIESGTIALIGAIVGLFVAFLTMRALTASFLFDVAGIKTVPIDYRVLLFTLFISILSVPLFGAVPGMRISRTNLADWTREGFSQMSQSSRLRRVQGVFVVTQVAFATVLLIGAMLTMKSLHSLSSINLGFNPHNVLTFNVTLPKTRYPNGQTQYAFFADTTRQIRSLPGVQQVGLISFLPLTGMTWDWSISIKGRDSAMNKTYPVNYRLVYEDYFLAMQIPLLKGRFPLAANPNNAPNEVVINQAMAKQFWPNQDPIGQRIKMGEQTSTAPWLSIVGVTADAKEVDLTDQPKPVFYVPYFQRPQPTMSFVIRTAEDPSNIISSVRERILAIDPNQPVYDIRTIEQVFANSTESSRFNTLLLSIFAAMATFIALVGIYGVMAYSVNQRSREIGIRLALGASRGEITAMLLRQALLLVSIGIGSGFLVATGFVRLLATLLYEVKPFDISVFGAVLVLLSAAAMFTSLLSALRAGRIDPYASLRYQ